MVLNSASARDKRFIFWAIFHAVILFVHKKLLLPEFLNIPLMPFNTIYTLNFTIYKWPKHTYTQFLWKSLQLNPWLILITAEALHIITNGSKGFSRQEYRSGQPFPSPGDLPNTGIEPRSPALQADSLSALPDSPGKPKKTGAGSHSFCSGDSPQGIFLLSQGSNPSLLYCRQFLSHLHHHGSPWMTTNTMERF